MPLAKCKWTNLVLFRFRGITRVHVPVGLMFNGAVKKVMYPMRIVLPTSWLVAFALCLSFPFLAHAQPKGVLSIGGAVTEFIYALGEESRLVGRDSTSMFPVAARALPNVGYMRALSPEGVLSVAPVLVLARENSGPAEAIEVLKSSGLEWIDVPDNFTRSGIMENVDIIAGALEVPEKGSALKSKIGIELDATQAIIDTITDTQTAIFILSMRDGAVMAAGQATGADGIMEMSGVTNAFKDFFGYRPVTDEAIIAAEPDVVLMMAPTPGRGHGITDEQILAHPALSQTPAARQLRFLRIDGSKALTFGPRTAEAALEVAEMVYGNLQ